VPVQHLVFMVHGIGQRLEKSNLVDDVSNFRQITSLLAEKHLTSYQRGIQRVLFIPCQHLLKRQGSDNRLFDVFPFAIMFDDKRVVLRMINHNYVKYFHRCFRLQSAK
ncbi:hypothetical protein Dimus_003392, partial [Dionaea muscipula]